jgi:hypothetical protein
MMNLEEIRDEVKIIIQDPDYSDDEIDKHINQALSYTAGLINLPDLKAIESVDTIVGQNYVNLSTVTGGFSGVLRRVVKEGIKIYPTLELLTSDYVGNWDAAGAVEAVCLESNILWYQKIPAEAESLMLILYKSPAELEDDDDIPSDLPSSLHKLLLVNGASFFIYNEIEDGIEGEKINTAVQFGFSFNEDNKHSGITKLKEHFARRRVHHIMSESGWGA